MSQRRVVSVPLRLRRRVTKSSLSMSRPRNTHISILPNVNEAHCVQHLSLNLRDAGCSSHMAMHGLAKAYTAADFERILSSFQQSNPKAYDCILGSDPTK